MPKKLAAKTKAHEMIQMMCNADERMIIEKELEVNLADTGVTVESALSFNHYL